MILNDYQGNLTSFAYDGDGLKRTGAATTTLIWDGADYLQGRS